MSDHLDSRAGRLAAALDDFLASSPDVEAAAVVSFDGLPMASALPADLEEDRVGAMSAALLSLGEQAAEGLGRGRLNQVLVEAEHGFVFLMSCGDQAVLSGIVSSSAKLGFVLYEMRRAADAVADALTVGGHDEPVEPVEPVELPRLSAVPAAPSWTHPSIYAEDDIPAEADDVAAEVAAVAAEVAGLRAVAADEPVWSPLPATPPPAVAPPREDEAEARADADADLLAVLATEPLGRTDDHDLLTEALFEVRRATGSDASSVPAWARPDAAENGWG